MDRRWAEMGPAEEEAGQTGTDGYSGKARRKRGNVGLLYAFVAFALLGRTSSTESVYKLQLAPSPWAHALVHANCAVPRAPSVLSEQEFLLEQNKNKTRHCRERSRSTRKDG